MQMAALTYQSHLMAATATNASLQALAQQQEQLHQTQHQIIEQLAALLIIQSNAGQGIGCHRRGPPHPPAPFAPNQFGCNNFGSRSGQGRGRGRGRGHGPPVFNAGRAPPLMSITTGRAPAFPGLDRRRILYAPAPSAGPVLKHHKEVCQLECLLLLWFQRGR